VNYEIKIEHSQDAKGSVDLDRMARLATGIRKISEGALQIRLRGISLTRGRKKVSLQNALKVSLTAMKPGSTILCLETKKFQETLPAYQTDIFRTKAQSELPNETPISLFISSFQNALSNEDSTEFLDKPLLRELRQLSSLFRSEQEVITFSNEGSLTELKLSSTDFKRIKLLEGEIPNPKPVVLNGVVEMLQFSKLKVKIKTEEGIVNGFLADDLKPDDIAAFFGKKITIRGISHYKPKGKSVIEIQRVTEPTEGDQYFSKKPTSETVEKQIERQVRKKGGNALAKIMGKWPGEETDEEFEQIIKELD